MKAVPIIFEDKEITAVEYRKGSNGKEKSLFLTWLINNICTNACSYCPPGVHNGTNHHYEWEHTERFINECFNKYGNIHCSVSGGEPTVSPFFKKFVNLIYDKGGTIHLTTNLVKSKNYWRDISFKFNSIAASYHPEYMLSDEEDDLFIEKANYIGQTTNLGIRIMMLPTMWDKCYNFYKKASKENKGYTIELVRILPNFGVGSDYCDIVYTDEQLEILNLHIPEAVYPNLKDLRRYTDESFLMYDNGTKEIKVLQDTVVYLENSKKANFLNWECDIGLESLFVHYDGKIQRGNCGVGGKIGNICDFDNIKWPEESIICNKTLCHCVADLLISKRIKD